MGEAAGRLWKIAIIETHIDSTTIQYEDRETDLETTPINTFSRVLSELSSQGISFEEQVKSLALLWSLPTSSEVFYMTFVNKYPKRNLAETIDQVLTKDIWRKSMGITIDDSAQAHNLTESIDRFNYLRKQAKRMGRKSSRAGHRENR